MNRREFFGAGAGLALGAAGVGAAKEAAIPDNEWGQEGQWVTMGPIFPEDHFFVSDKPELELGHSARWKIQRYPGAKWTAIHRGEGHWLPPYENWVSLSVIRPINPIITNCDFNLPERKA